MFMNREDFSFQREFRGSSEGMSKKLAMHILLLALQMLFAECLLSAGVEPSHLGVSRPTSLLSLRKTQRHVDDGLL